MNPRMRGELLFWGVVIVILGALVFAVLKLNAQPATSTVTLQWTAPYDSKPNGRGVRTFAYDLRSGTDSAAFLANPLTGVVHPTPAPKDSGLAELVSISGLAAETRYWFLIRSRDTAGNWSAWSNLAVKVTPDTRNPFSVFDLR